MRRAGPAVALTLLGPPAAVVVVAAFVTIAILSMPALAVAVFVGIVLDDDDLADRIWDATPLGLAVSASRRGRRLSGLL